jgi:hypothetical protein
VVLFRLVSLVNLEHPEFQFHLGYLLFLAALVVPEVLVNLVVLEHLGYQLCLEHPEYLYHQIN